MHPNRRRLATCAGLLVLLPALLLGCGPKATAGGLAGGAIGDALDQRDKEIAMKAAQQSLEGQRSGSTQGWKNPDSGSSGTFTPTRTYQDGEGLRHHLPSARRQLEGRQTGRSGTHPQAYLCGPARKSHNRALSRRSPRHALEWVAFGRSGFWRYRWQRQARPASTRRRG
jgi:surface antigen